MLGYNLTRQNYDGCSYEEKLKRTMGPGFYQTNKLSNDFQMCQRDVPADPSLRYQKFGYSTCVQGQTIDDESELRRLNYKNSKCNEDSYNPGSYIANGLCSVDGKVGVRDCGSNPQESTRLSNPPCNLHGTGINRWNWLCFDPQEHVLERFNREATDSKVLFKDNHVPCLEKLMDQQGLLPPEENNSFDPSWKLSKENGLNKLENKYTYGLTPQTKCVS